MRSRNSLLLDGLAVALPPLAMACAALATKSFWGDEILSMQFASADARGLFSELSGDYHPPLYFLLLRAWLALFGDGEAGLRLFQAAQGAGLMAASLALFRAVLPGRRYHPALLLLLLSVPLWLFVPMLRYYALAAGIAVYATVLLLRWLERGGRGRAAGLAAVYAVLLYTDYPSSFVILSHALFVLWKHRARLRQYLAAAAAAAALFSPWIVVVLTQVSHLADASQNADLNSGPAAILLKAAYSAYAFLIGETMYPAEPAGIIAMLTLALLAVLFIGHRGHRALPAVQVFIPAAALIGVLSTSVVTTVLSRHTSFIYTPPRTLYALPFIVATLGIMLDRIPGALPRRALLAVLLAVSAYGVANTVANRHFFMPVYASPWKQIAAATSGAGGFVLADESLCYDWYAQRAGGIRPQRIAPADTAQFMQLLSAWERRDSPVTLFLILTERESTTPEINPDVVRAVRARMMQTGHTVFVPYDDTYKWMKTALLRRAPGEGKIHLYRYALARKRFVVTR